MLHFKISRVLTKEHFARVACNKFWSYGASAHRLGNSTEFIILIPIKRPERRAALLKMLMRNSLGEEFEIVDVYSFEGGPQYRIVDESELDERGRLINDANNEPVSAEPASVNAASVAVQDKDGRVIRLVTPANNEPASVDAEFESESEFDYVQL